MDWARNSQYKLIGFLAVICFLLTSMELYSIRRGQDNYELRVRLPRIIQILTACGDKYLAANLAVMRSLQNNFTAEDSYEHYEIQEILQLDAAWFNPRHEDNYYIAAALLSWSGHVAAAEKILIVAANSRPFDMLPPFFLAFDYYHFDNKVELGARWMYEAAKRADTESNRVSMSKIASRWAENGADPREGLRMVRMMRDAARSEKLKNYLIARESRIEGLVNLRDAALLFKKNERQPLASLDQLVKFKYIKELPGDPIGNGYEVDSHGIPQFKNSGNR